MRKAFIISKENDRYTWRLRGENGKTIATGSTFLRKFDVVQAIKNLHLQLDAKIIDETKE